MPVVLCPRCRRANPDEAAFCHFDGQVLRVGPGQVVPLDPTRLPHEFVFPSGRRCRSYDELAVGCQEEWGTARELLRHGAFRQFLTGLGRHDLARVAEDASRAQADPDIALSTFISGLPATTKLPEPDLDLRPR